MRVALATIVVVAVAMTTLVCASSQSEPLVVDVPTNLPPLARHVMRWTVADVERWMLLTIGYPELTEQVQAYLIDGPTLLTLDMNRVFGGAAGAHPTQIAKLRAHQQLLRGQCVCGGLAAGSSSAAAGAVNTLSTYLANAGGSTLFHLALAAFAPRIAFLSMWYFDAPLMCCLLGPGSAPPAISDAAALEALEQQFIGRAAAESAGAASAAVVQYPCGMESSAATDAGCQQTPGWMLVVLVMISPFGVFTWLGLSVLWSHWLLGSVWLFSFAAMCVIELLQGVEWISSLRANGVGSIDVKALLMEGFGDLLNPLMLLVPLGLVIGRWLPAWVGWLFVLGMTGLVAFLIARIILNVLMAFIPKSDGGKAEEGGGAGGSSQ